MIKQAEKAWSKLKKKQVDWGFEEQKESEEEEEDEIDALATDGVPGKTSKN